jgi:HEAT repeat protein
VNSILRTLSSLKTIARPAIPYLLGRIKDCPMVIGTLVEIGVEPESLPPRPKPELAPFLTGPQAKFAHYEAERVARLLVRDDPAEARRQVSLLIPKLADPLKPIEQVTLYALTGLAREAQAAVPLLISLLCDRGGEAAYCAAQALGELGPDAAPAVPRLIAILEVARSKGEIEQHRMRITLLGKIGPAAASAVPLLLELLDDSQQAAPTKYPVDGQGELRTFHADVMPALVKISPDSAEVVEAIRRQLSSSSALLRSTALGTLALSIYDSPQVLTDIIEILRRDTERTVRADAAKAIAAMSGDRVQAIDPLIESLGDSDPNVRNMAATALGTMGTAASSAVPALRHALLESRCGIPGPPQDVYGVHRPVPLTQTLRRALEDIERSE